MSNDFHMWDSIIPHKHWRLCLLKQCYSLQLIMLKPRLLLIILLGLGSNCITLSSLQLFTFVSTIIIKKYVSNIENVCFYVKNYATHTPFRLKRIVMYPDLSQSASFLKNDGNQQFIYCVALSKCIICNITNTSNGFTLTFGHMLLSANKLCVLSTTIFDDDQHLNKIFKANFIVWAQSFSKLFHYPVGWIRGHQSGQAAKCVPSALYSKDSLIRQLLLQSPDGMCLIHTLWH